MTVRGPRPLPECSVCQTPTRRRTYDVNGGLCTACHLTYQASRGTQTQLLLSVPELPAERDLSNVVVFRTHQNRKGPHRGQR